MYTLEYMVLMYCQKVTLDEFLYSLRTSERLQKATKHYLATLRLLLSFMFHSEQ